MLLILLYFHSKLYEFDNGRNYYIIISLMNKAPQSLGDWYIHWGISINSIHRLLESLWVWAWILVIEIIYWYSNPYEYYYQSSPKAGTFTSIWFIPSSYMTDSIKPSMKVLSVLKSVTEDVTASSLYIRSRDFFFSNRSIICNPYYFDYNHHHLIT